MGRFVKGDIVRILFRFSDLKNAKPRPALVLADLAGQDFILCQISKKRPTFDHGIELTQDSFTGSPLPVIPSYVRPAKLFTADNSLIDITKRLKIPRRSTRLPGESDFDVFRDRGRAMTEKACGFYGSL